MRQTLLSFLLSSLLSNLWDRKSDMNDKLIIVWYRVNNTIKLMGFFDNWIEAHTWGENLAQQGIITEYRIYKLVTLEEGE